MRKPKLWKIFEIYMHHTPDDPRYVPKYTKASLEVSPITLAVILFAVVLLLLLC